MHALFALTVMNTHAGTLDAALQAGLAGLEADAPGCVLGIYQGGELVGSRAVGFAVEGGPPLDANTSLRIASASKQFTAASILLLAAEGQVDLDAPVQTWIPELADTPPVTLRQLVHHTSGLRDYLALMALSGIDEPYGLDQVLPVLVQQRGGSFPPGTAHSYSNTGYLLLGEVVARVSGTSLRTYADAHLFGPLGMEHTRFLDDTTEDWSTRARGYAVQGKRVIDDDPVSNLVGDGGVYTSITDLTGWMRQLREDLLHIRDAQLARIELPDGTSLPYAAGLVHASIHGLPAVSHGGSYGGFRADLTWFPDQDTGIACLCNRSNGRPSPRIAATAKVLLDDAIDAASAAPPPATEPVPPADLSRYAGDYVVKPGQLLAIRVQGDQVEAQMTGQAARPLTWLGDDRFQRADVGLLLTFLEVDAGPASSVRLQQGGVDLLLPRATPLPPAGDHSHLPRRWRCDEVALDLDVRIRGDAMVAKSHLGTLRLERTAADRFAAPGFEVALERGPEGQVITLTFSPERAQGLRCASSATRR